MNRALSSCHACRYSLLDAFAGLAGVSIPPRPSRNLKLSSQPLKAERRGYTSMPLFRQSSVESSTESSSLAPQDLPEDSSPVPPSSTSTITTDSAPWYLSIPTPQPPAPVSPLLALQEIPPLPSNPPAILSPLLTHLSESIGLDNLTLLDLRHLNPPSALGANLLMIIGTARSVKHLNVSADRFCRWLRTEYRLRPYADGLLGRNELKLKLRRKARRQKMMGLVGAGGRVESADDGITTGWVCVNVGIIGDDIVPRSMQEKAIDEREEGVTASTPSISESGSGSSAEPDLDLDEEEYQNPSPSSLETEEADPSRDPNYVGFGSSTTAPRIVVQMFTEEKRAEMDLEGLWEHRNTKRDLKNERREGEFEDSVLAKELRSFEGKREMSAGWVRERKRERDSDQGRGDEHRGKGGHTQRGLESEASLRKRGPSEEGSAAGVGGRRGGGARGKERDSIFGD